MSEMMKQKTLEGSVWSPPYLQHQHQNWNRYKTAKISVSRSGLEPGTAALRTDDSIYGSLTLLLRHEPHFNLFPVHQILVIKEEVPHDWSTSLEQQNSEFPFIKEEDEQLWISQEQKQLIVKSEDEEKPPLSEFQLLKTEVDRETEAPTSCLAEHMQAEPDDEDCGGPQPERNSEPVCSSKQSRMKVLNRDEETKLCSKPK
ncbi:hypothetical protein AMECASPLE_026335, partial [Ameca splendens]